MVSNITCDFPESSVVLASWIDFDAFKKASELKSDP